MESEIVRANLYILLDRYLHPRHEDGNFSHEMIPTSLEQRLLLFP